MTDEASACNAGVMICNRCATKRMNQSSVQ
ncbi:hypothetical protein F2S88_01680 [Pseudomonas syringae pv. actinidiae]|nr:hypothetical protein [Pseudomonas syringae pv. actinidiae]